MPHLGLISKVLAAAAKLDLPPRPCLRLGTSGQNHHGIELTLNWMHLPVLCHVDLLTTCSLWLLAEMLKPILAHDGKNIFGIYASGDMLTCMRSAWLWLRGGRFQSLDTRSSPFSCCLSAVVHVVKSTASQSHGKPLFQQSPTHHATWRHF